MKKETANLFGDCDERFAKVGKAFAENFAGGWEREGASVAVYYRGELVVDLCGGYKDASALEKWTTETRTVVFSVTKVRGCGNLNSVFSAVASVCIALLVDRKVIRYDQKISEFWPAFGLNGKDEITVECVMTHQSGLGCFDQPVTLEVAQNPETMAKIIERQTPKWIPNTKTGYHAMTFGWLVDQIIRHADSQNRGVAQFFNDEISKPFDIDVKFGITSADEHTVSRLSYPPRRSIFREIIYDPRVLLSMMLLTIGGGESLVAQMKGMSDWVRIDRKHLTFNNPEVHRLEQAAALGITTARDLAKLFAVMASGKLISKETLDIIAKPQLVDRFDVSVRVPMTKGYGFMYERHPFKREKWLYGHPGFGGSNLVMDAEEELVIAYVTNGIKAGGGELTRTYRKLRNAALKSIRPSK